MRDELTAEGSRPDAEAQFLEQLRTGDAEAGRRFVTEHYPSVHRYLLALTGQPELAEDLTQETFLQGWQHLNTFRGRASLRTWLHRIARREFLQALRGRKDQIALDETREMAAPGGTAWTAAIELRGVIDRLPLPEREVVLLHYLEGCSTAEIARIVDAPVGTVCYRLGRARERLRQELGEDDLSYLNDALAPMRQWNWLPLQQMHALEMRLTRSGIEETKEQPMERRAFLRQAAVGVAGVVLSGPEKEVVDDRLTRKVTCAFKGTALSDLCEKLKSDTGVHLTAGPSVADEKVTLFCEKLPLREVMRQLSRPFGYTWLRSGKPGEYDYELMQDLRSQLLEEELRNRDRHAAMVALDQEIQQLRPYLDLSPDEALEKAKTAPPDEKARLERFAGLGWGVGQLYFRLSPEQLNRLWAGEELEFRGDPGTDTAQLPSELAAGVLASLRHRRLIVNGDSLQWGNETSLPGGVPPAQVEGARPLVHLRIVQSELGQYALEGYSGLTLQSPDAILITQDDARALGPLATGASPPATPAGSDATTRWSRDPALQRRASDFGLSTKSKAPDDRAPLPDQSKIRNPESKITTADVLEALHRATGMPVVGDYYTRLFPATAVPRGEQRLYNLLNQCADALRLRWRKEDDWLQFRSATYFQDRLKEVPTRLLSRWAQERSDAGVRRRVPAERVMGWLALDELIEIAGLSDAQLDGSDMAEGARTIWGLEEWDLARNPKLRPHWRFLAMLTPAQRQEAAGPAGLALTRLTLSQQQQFLRLGLGTSTGSLGMPELAAACLKTGYTVPGGFQWPAPGTPDLAFPGSLQRPRVREQTRAAALAAARKLDPAVADAAIVPTTLDGMLIYTFGTPNGHYAVRVVSTTRSSFMTD